MIIQKRQKKKNKFSFVADCINQKFLDYLDIFIEIEFFKYKIIIEDELNKI